MNGARFDIDINAENLGVNSATDELNAFADKIRQTNTVATQFDKVVAAARVRLEESANAAKVAAAALATAEARYKELESAANKAAKEVEKAALAGKSTDALKIAAAAAAEKMKVQATAVDQLRAKSDAAAAAQSRLATSLKTLEGQQASAVSKMKSAQSATSGAANALDALGANDKLGKLKKLASGFTSLHGATLLVGLGVLGLTVAAVAGIRSLAKMTGMKFDGFNKALADIKSLFDDGTSSAEGMKTLVSTILGPLDAAAGKSGPLVKEMFKGLIYGALQVVIAVLKLRNQIFAAMSPETRAAIKSVVDQVFSLDGAFKIGTVGAGILVATFAVLTVALIALAVAEIAALWPILLIVAAVAAVIAILMNWGAIVDWLKGMWDGFVAFIKRIPEAWVNAAKAMIDGLVKGIKDGAAAVWKAMEELAGGAIKAFKAKLGIKSPSAVMQMQANYTTQGFVEGLEDGSKDVDAAMQSMVAVPEASSSQPRAQATGGSRTIHIAQLTVGDSPVAQSNFASLKQALVDALEGATITIGGAEAPAT